MKEAKHVADSLAEQVRMVLPTDINGNGNLFGGKLMEWIDVLAGIVARRHSESNVLTAAIDNIQFKKGAKLSDILVLVGKLTYVGTTSMEVRIDTYVEDIKGMRRSINRAYVVMVAVDEAGRPVRVPGLLAESISEQIEWEGGKQRYRLRKERRQEGY